MEQPQDLHPSTLIPAGATAGEVPAHRSIGV
jgi:hypothetical protein